MEQGERPVCAECNEHKSQDEMSLMEPHLCRNSRDTWEAVYAWQEEDYGAY